MKPIRVKYLSKHPDRSLAPPLRVGNCEFVFDREERNYDWLVAYDDLPSAGGTNGREWEEVLACPPAHTLLLTVEPSSIKVYGRAFLGQFAWILTSHEPWSISHPGTIRRQPGLAQFHRGAALDDAVPEKTGVFSTVCSDKAQKHTLHHLRLSFTKRLKAEMPELAWFGHGIRPMKEKNEALDPYKYHLAVENHLAPHHITEKLSDCFLGFCLPFYFGAPNAADYYPAESFIPVDLRDFDGALKTIREAIAGGEYEKRLPAIREARRLALTKWATFPQLAELIEERHGKPCHADGWRTRSLKNRHLLRRTSLAASLEQGWDVVVARIRALTRNAW